MTIENISVKLVIIITIIFLISLISFLIGYFNESNKMKLVAVILGVIDLLLIFIDSIRRKKSK